MSMEQRLGDQVGQDVHQALRMHCTASWHGHGLVVGKARGGKTAAELRQSKKQSVGPCSGLAAHVLVLPCYVFAVIIFPL